MRENYLQFMAECDRLKKYFLLEAEGDDSDLAEAGSDEDTGDTEGGNDSGKDKDEKKKESDGKEKPAEKDTGNTDKAQKPEHEPEREPQPAQSPQASPATAPDPSKVNAAGRAPGAISPQALIAEMSSGKDNIYTRVLGVLRTRFPKGECQVKDMIEPISHAVSAFMKNKNYAPLPKDTMKAVCLNIAKQISERSAASKKAQPHPQQGQQKMEAAYFSKKRPCIESLGLLESWKELLLAGGIAAGSAGAATAPSAPESTLRGTPRYTAMQDGTQVGRQDKQGQQPVGMSSVPKTANSGNVAFSKDSTYQLSPDDYVDYKSAGNLPENYVVSGGSGKGKTDTPVAKGGSVMQGVVKEQAKSGKTTGEIAGKCKESTGNPDAFRKTVHETGHKAVDAAIKGGSAVVGGLIGGAKGMVRGAKEAWNRASRGIESDHDKMVSERETKKK